MLRTAVWEALQRYQGVFLQRNDRSEMVALDDMLRNGADKVERDLERAGLLYQQAVVSGKDTAVQRLLALQGGEAEAQSWDHDGWDFGEGNTGTWVASVH